MKTDTVNISFQKSLRKQIDDVATQESCTRSELVREAARMYVASQSFVSLLSQYLID